MRKLAILVLLILTASTVGGQAVFAQFISAPDLTVDVIAPTSAFPGEDITPGLDVTVNNIGTDTAIGNLTSPGNGYIIDLVLSSDKVVPPCFAIFSANYSEDVLLKGGRDSNTKDLFISTSVKANVFGTIPADTPPGNYFVCAQVDPPDFIIELDETNNVGCSPLVVTAQVQQISAPLLIDGPTRWPISYSA